jgi:hypothetical protein
MENPDSLVDALARARPIFDYLGDWVRDMSPSADENPSSQIDAEDPEHIWLES